MCVRPQRDDKGRLLPGARLNPDGRPPASEIAKMVEVARRLGASISIVLPPAEVEAPAVPPVVTR